MTDPKSWRLGAVHETAMGKGCWIWTRCKSKDGHGLVWNGSGSTKIHRAVFHAVIGETDLDLHHLCGVKECFNPRHLLPVGPLAHQYLHGGFMIRQYRGDKCRVGHPLSGNNLACYKRKSGAIERKCLACKREDSLRRYYEVRNG